MAHLIDKDKAIAEIKNLSAYLDTLHEQRIIEKIFSIMDTLEVKEVDLSDIKTEWSPTKKQMQSLHDMLKYNIGVFDYQKFMEVKSLYDYLTKILDYETDRQRQSNSRDREKN